MSNAYKKAGVDIFKAESFVTSISAMAKQTMNANVKKSIGGYASLYKISDKANRYIAATTDGVGTKLKLAFALNQHDTVGIDLVAMSVNDLICVGANPLFFLDYFATGKLDLKTSESVMKGIVEGCRQGRLALTGGETAEMPDLYARGEYDLAGFAVGMVDEANLIDGSQVKSGDLILGIESSGPHSNGFSLIRKIFSMYKKDRHWIEKCFQPTLIYVDAVLSLRDALAKKLKGLAHITGSGFLNIPRINDKFDYEIVLPDSFTTPDIFLELQSRGDLSAKDAYTTFNMGIGMVAVIDPAALTQAQRVLSRHGVHAHVLGHVAPSRKKCHVLVRDKKHSVDLALRY